MTNDNQTKDKGEYVTTVMGEVITEALAVQLDDIERRIAEYLKAGNYSAIQMLSEKAVKIELLRMSICTKLIPRQSPALRDVAAERHRQVTAEGWTPEHDDEHVEGQIADAAACYAYFADNQGFSVPAPWPWSPEWWKQSGQRRDLVKAGALILAEIERIDRQEQAAHEQ